MLICDVCHTPQPTARPCGPCKANICDNCRGDVPARAKAMAQRSPWLAIGIGVAVFVFFGLMAAYIHNNLNTPSHENE